MATLINIPLQDQSFEKLFGCMPSITTPRELRIVVHLTYVENLLRGSPALTNYSQRLKHLDELQHYIRQKGFPSSFDTEFVSGRPCFIDNEHNYCAVGHLMKMDGRDDLAKKINQLHRYDLIKDFDLSKLPGLLEWVEGCGLTLEELAMIQPTYDHMRFPSMPSPPRMPSLPAQVVHTSIVCDGCQMNPLRGDRYWCTGCPDFDFCATCERTQYHDPTHLFVKIKQPDAKVKQTVVGLLKQAGHLKPPPDPEWEEFDKLDEKASIVDFVKALLKDDSTSLPEVLMKFTTAEPPVTTLGGVLTLSEEDVKKIGLSLVMRRKVTNFIERRKKMKAEGF